MADTDAVVLAEVPSSVLAVYAHPDDPEVACGGTVARWAGEGASVHLVVACTGDKGSDDPTTDPAELAVRRAAEMAEAADDLGAASLELLGHPDGELDGVRTLRHDLVRIIRRLRPEVVVCPDPTAVFFGDGYVNHVDHRALGWATLDAVAPAAASPLYQPDAGAAHQVATMLLSGTLDPDVWIDIEGSVDLKVRALFRHRTQLADDADEWLGDFIRHRATEEGRRAGLRSAESFRRIRFARP